MNGPSGTHAARLRARQPRADCPQARIVLFSADPTNEVVGAELGADGFLLKGEPLSQLTGLLGPQ